MYTCINNPYFFFFFLEYKVKQQKNNSMNTSNILGLIRETLDDFENDKTVS